MKNRVKKFVDDETFEMYRYVFNIEDTDTIVKQVIGILGDKMRNTFDTLDTEMQQTTLEFLECSLIELEDREAFHTCQEIVNYYPELLLA